MKSCVYRISIYIYIYIYCACNSYIYSVHVTVRFGQPRLKVNFSTFRFDPLKKK